MEIKKYYDVIIVGAGIAGTKLALELNSSDKSVLLLERNSQLGIKACGHGITIGDKNLFSETDLTIPFTKISINYGKIRTVFPKSGDAIASIDRAEYLGRCLDQIKKSKNIDYLQSKSFKITPDNEVDVDGRTISYRFLVGADGSNSQVRAHLGLKTKRAGIGLTYLVPKKFDKFEVFYDQTYFGSGYLWIFPNKNFTSIGCGSDIKLISGKKLRENFERWLTEKKIDFSGAEFKSAILNCDYKGYKFNNIYLIGDAAGLVSGLTGKGMFAAIVSAKQVAREILGKKYKSNLIEKWLKRKKRQEFLQKIIASKYLGKISISFLLVFLRCHKYRQVKSFE